MITHIEATRYRYAGRALATESAQTSSIEDGHPELTPGNKTLPPMLVYSQIARAVSAAGCVALLFAVVRHSARGTH